MTKFKMHINKINPKSKQRLKTITVVMGAKKRVFERTFALANCPEFHKNQIGPSNELSANVTFCFVILFATLVASAQLGVSSSGLLELKQQIRAGGALKFTLRDSRQLHQRDQNGFRLHELYSMGLEDQNQSGASELATQSQSSPAPASATTRNLIESSSMSPTSLFNLAGQVRQTSSSNNQRNGGNNSFECPNGLLTFELATGFIYKPSGSDETLSMMPTLQLTDCLEFCLQNASCLAINFEMGLCVLLASSAKQNQQNLFASQFPVFTIYAEKKCLLTDPEQAKQRRRCQRAWTFERVAGYEMKTKPRRRLKLANKELCMEACLVEREFACRSANWHRQTGECSLNEQDRHSVSQSEAGDQRIKTSLSSFYGPQSNNLTTTLTNGERQQPQLATYQKLHYFEPSSIDRSRLIGQLEPSSKLVNATTNQVNTKLQPQIASALKQLFYKVPPAGERNGRESQMKATDWPVSMQQHYVDLPGDIQVDYLENNCIYEPNKLCEFRKIQNRVLKTVDSIYQDVNSLEECRQKCLNAPYRCYSFDYGDTSDRVCRTSHLDQASLLSVNEPYLEVAGAITYELASCFNVTIQCRAKGMVAQVSSSKSFNGRIYAKSRPSSCMEDVSNSLKFELNMKYHDDACDVRATSNQHQGVFSNDIIIQHHDSIVTTQDVGLSVYCQYDLGNRSVTNNVDLAIERLPENPMESKQQQNGGPSTASGGVSGPSASGPLTITSLATTVVKSPNVTMRITNMNGQPVASATVGDRLALLFEIKEKTSPFGILVREIVAMDGRQLDFVNGSSQLTNSSQLYQQQYAADLQAQQPTNSIQFLDHTGCPTDVRLMGPLVRMDPQGHRLLAPFDAFKFPSSEMVLFRAVVSSCVSDCKPAECLGSDSGGPLGQPELAPPSYGDLFSPTPPDDVVATTRNMPTSSTTTTTTTTGSTTNQQQRVSSSSSERPLTSSTVGSTAAATTSGTEAPSRAQQTSFASTLAPYESGRTTKLHNQQTDLMPDLSDLLTTLPGGVNVPQFAAMTMNDQSTTTMSSALVDSSEMLSNDHGNETNSSSEQAQDQSSDRISMTNNHNLGRPTPRPMTTTTAVISDKNNENNYTANGHDLHANYQQQETGPTSGQLGRPILPPPAKLYPLTDDEQEAIFRLLAAYGSSTQIFSSSSAPGETLNSSLALEAGSEKDLTSGLTKLYPTVEWFLGENIDSHELSPFRAIRPDDNRQAMTAKEILDKIKIRIQELGPYWQEKILEHDDVIKRPSPKSEPVYPTDRELLLASTLVCWLSVEMLFDEARAKVRQEPGFDEKIEFASERISLEEAKDRRPSLSRHFLFEPSTRVDAEADLQSRKFPTELFEKFSNLPVSESIFESNNLTFAQAAERVVLSAIFGLANRVERIKDNMRRVKELVRSKRDVAEEELRRSSGYVYMSQPQQTTNLHELKFTNGHVEMYHTNQLHRIKRQAPVFEEFEAHPQPRDQRKDKLEEMVVQSIKIVDKIHFEDEQLRERQSRIQRPLKSRLSAINILLVAMCFISIQILMVLLCLINWNRQQRGQRQNRSLFPDLASFKTCDSSTISSSMTYSDCSNYR